MTVQKSILEKRKEEHLEIVINKNVEPVPSAFEEYRLPYSSLPEINLKEIKTDMSFFGKKISMPLMVASMTGGSTKAKIINTNLAKACETKKIPLALGSMRIVLKEPEMLTTFDVRELCPSVPLFVNFGMVQLNYGYGLDDINRLIDLVEADGIFLHINHMQEAVQPEGDTNFKDLFKKLEKIMQKIKKPVLAKEVGSGIDGVTAKRLFETGIKWIDTAGLGGTNWSMVEAYRRKDDLGKVAAHLGIPTTESILELKKIKGLKIIAGGGIRTGIDIVKALALGAELASAAKPFLEPALDSKDAVIKEIERFEKEFRVTMFSAGVGRLDQVRKLKLSKIC